MQGIRLFRHPSWESGMQHFLAKAEAVASLGTGLPVEARRSVWTIAFDPETHTVILDNVHHKVDDPKAFAVYKAIVDNRPQPLTRIQLGDKVPGCKGGRTVRNLLDKLPVALRNTVRSGPPGYWFDAAGRADEER
jgi:hypothetical protein